MRVNYSVDQIKRGQLTVLLVNKVLFFFTFILVLYRPIVLLYISYLLVGFNFA